MIYVRRLVVPSRFLRSVRAVFAYAAGRPSVSAGEVFRIVWPITGYPASFVFLPVYRALDSLSCSYATYDDFLGVCLREGGYL